jgi:hypothetical protein
MTDAGKCARAEAQQRGLDLLRALKGWRPSMSDPNGWPDPQRPGVPLNPERDGYHWLSVDASGEPCPFEWRATKQQWCDGSNSNEWTCPHHMLPIWEIYLGPCLTPAEVAARVAEARRETLREAQDAVWRIRDPGFPDDNATDKAIRGHYNAGVAGAVQAIAAILARAEDKP